MKRIGLFLLLAGLLLCLAGCAAMVDPVARVAATDVPGLSMELHAASANESSADTLQATLYYRFLDQPWLAPESRTLTIRRDESAELAVVNALLGGPSAGNSELKRLFAETVRAQSVRVENNILFVTLNEAFMTDDGIPQDWLTRPEWSTEAPLRRALTVQSLVCTLTECFSYPSVQLMVQQKDGARMSLRLDNGYFLDGRTGPSDPQKREEGYLLTPHNAAAALLDACVKRDLSTLYTFVAARSGGEQKPLFDSFAQAVADANSLLAHAVSAGGVSQDGQSALLTVDLTLSRMDGQYDCTGYPLRLERENGLWKIAYDRLMAMLIQ